MKTSDELRDRAPMSASSRGRQRCCDALVVHGDLFLCAGFPAGFRYAWLKKPPRSSMRARSSAETSTLRGVSRKTLSATRCMPPSSA